MEQTRLKRRLVTARRGHKLLKDKRDELMRQFLEIVRRNLQLRKKVEKALEKAHASFTIASAVMSPEMLEEALMYPKQSVSLELSTKNVMSVNVPVYKFKMKSDSPSEIFPYGFATTSGELDDAVLYLSQTLYDLLELAQSEKAAQMLALEIEKTRRRVNALEYVMIPQMVETIRYIRMKLEENERGNTTRLMKVKDMMLEEQRQKNIQFDNLARS
jgi:V/A-type H+-transporting ATPase subunit D